MPKVKVGIFDSGVGGLSVVAAIKKALPDLEIIYKDDKAHIPYGNRDIDQIHGFIKPIFQSFIDEGCQAVVIACNTVTTNLIDQLRSEFALPIVGMEPAIKPAVEASKSGVIMVCATPRTLSSERYKWLKSQYAPGVKVIEPDCSDWAMMIENQRLNRQKIADIVNRACEDGADVIVLGCTHYHWIEDLINELAGGGAKVLQPEAPTIVQLRRVLAQLP